LGDVWLPLANQILAMAPCLLLNERLHESLASRVIHINLKDEKIGLLFFAFWRHDFQKSGGPVRRLYPCVTLSVVAPAAYVICIRCVCCVLFLLSFASKIPRALRHLCCLGWKPGLNSRHTEIHQAPTSPAVFCPLDLISTTPRWRTWRYPIRAREVGYLNGKTTGLGKHDPMQEFGRMDCNAFHSLETILIIIIIIRVGIGLYTRARKGRFNGKVDVWNSLKTNYY